MKILVLCFALFISGCINVTTRLTPEDTAIPATHKGEDCVLNLLNIMIGTVTVEQAMANATAYADVAAANAINNKNDSHLASAPVRPITKIRSVQVNNVAFLIAGTQCVEVVGTN